MKIDDIQGNISDNEIDPSSTVTNTTNSQILDESEDYEKRKELSSSFTVEEKKE